MRLSQLLFARRRHPNRLGRQVRTDFLAHYAHGRFGDAGCASRRMDGVGHGQFDCALIGTAADHLQQNDICVGLNVELAALLRLILHLVLYHLDWILRILRRNAVGGRLSRRPLAIHDTDLRIEPETGLDFVGGARGSAHSKTNSTIPQMRYLMRMKPSAALKIRRIYRGTIARRPRSRTSKSRALNPTLIPRIRISVAAELPQLCAREVSIR